MRIKSDTNRINLNNRPQFGHAMLERDNNFQRDGNFDDAFRFAGVAGQGNVPMLSKNELTALKILNGTPKPVSNEYADEVLRSMSYSDRDIREYRARVDNDEFFNNFVNALNLISADTSKFVLSFETVEQVSKNNNIKKLFLVNNENIKLLDEYTHNRYESIRTLWSIVNLYFKNIRNIEKMLSTSLDISEVCDGELHSILEGMRFPNKPELFSSKRLSAYKKFTDAMGIKLDYKKVKELKNPELITPEFIEEFKAVVDKLKKQNIQTPYNQSIHDTFTNSKSPVSKDPVRELEQYKYILSRLEEYDMDFSWWKNINLGFNKTIPLSTIIPLVSSNSLEQSAELLKKYERHIKDRYPNMVLNSLSNELCLKNIDGCAKFLNTIAKIPTSGTNFSNILDIIKKYNVKDFDGLNKVAAAFAEVGVYPDYYTAEHPLFGRDVFGNTDYDAEVNFIRLLADFYSTENSRYSIADYMAADWPPVNFGKAQEYFKILNDNGLKGQVEPSDLKTLFSNPQEDKILNQILKFNHHPAYSGNANYFYPYSEEALADAFDRLDCLVKEANPEYSHLSARDIEKMMKEGPFFMREVVLRYLKTGEFPDALKLSMKVFIDKEKLDLIELLNVKNDRKYTEIEKNNILQNFQLYHKGENGYQDEYFEYTKKLLNSDLPRIAVLNRIDKKFVCDRDVAMHEQLVEDAFENRDLLKDGLGELTDGALRYYMNRKETVMALNLLGKGNLEAAFTSKMTGFNDVCDDIAEFNLTPENREKLLQKINPLNSKKYVEYTKTIKNLKSKFKALKNNTNNFDKNSDEAKKLMSEIKAKTREMKDFVEASAKFNPQEVLDKVRVLAVINSTNPEQTARFIDLMQPSSPQSDEVWNKETNKLIYQLMKVESDDNLNKKLDLLHSKYLSKLAISLTKNDYSKSHSLLSFADYLKKLVLLIKDNPDKSIEEVIDSLPQNIATKEKFQKIGVDYEKWTKYNPNSYLDVEIKLDAEKSKRAVIASLENDLTDDMFRALPLQIQKEIWDALAEIGVYLKSAEDEDKTGLSHFLRDNSDCKLYKNDKPIEFEDVKQIINCIKNTINSNEFWSKVNPNPEIELARGTVYNHLIKQRKTQYNNAKSLKGKESVTLKVSKANMYDVKKVLGLGNEGQCCTALGGLFNEYTAPTYIMNKCIGAIELTDDGEYVGNTMIYLARVDAKPALVLDNIELKSKYQKNDAIRDAFVEYAKKLCEEIGVPDLPIYAGPKRHKVDMDKFMFIERTMSVIGSTGEDEIYLDYDAQPHIIDKEMPKKIFMYDIR